LAKRSYLRDISGVFGSYVISLVASFSVYIILTRLLGPEKFGVYSTLLVIPLITVGFVQMGIRRAALFHLGKKHFPEQRIVSAVFTLLLIASFFGILVSGAGFLVYNHPAYKTSYMLMVLLAIPFKLAVLYTGGIFLGKDEIRSVNLQNWTPLVLNLLFVALFVWIFPMDILGATIAYMLSNGLVAVYYLVTLYRKYHVTLGFDRDVIRLLVAKGVLFAVSFVVMQLNLRVDLLILGRIGVAAETGYYSLAVQIAEQLWLLPAAVGVVVMSRTANSTSQTKMTEETSRLMRLTLLAGALISLALVLVVPWLVPLLFGPAFSESSQLILWLLPGIMAFMVFRVLNGQLSGMGRPGYSAVIFSFALLINVLLNFLWIPRYGARGAAWATDISYFAGSLALTVAYCYVNHTSFFRLFCPHKSDLSGLGNRFHAYFTNK